MGSDCMSQRCRGDRCYAFLTVSSDGTLFRRGCLIGPESPRLTCSGAASDNRVVACCSQPMCNANASVESLRHLLLMSKSRPSFNRPVNLIIPSGFGVKWLDFSSMVVNGTRRLKHYYSHFIHYPDLPVSLHKPFEFIWDVDSKIVVNLWRLCWLQH